MGREAGFLPICLSVCLAGCGLGGRLGPLAFSACSLCVCLSLPPVSPALPPLHERDLPLLTASLCMRYLPGIHGTPHPALPLETVKNRGRTAHPSPGATPGPPGLSCFPRGPGAAPSPPPRLFCTQAWQVSLGDGCWGRSSHSGMSLGPHLDSLGALPAHASHPESAVPRRAGNAGGNTPVGGTVSARELCTSWRQVRGNTPTSQPGPRKA